MKAESHFIWYNKTLYKFPIIMKFFRTDQRIKLASTQPTVTTVQI